MNAAVSDTTKENILRATEGETASAAQAKKKRKKEPKKEKRIINHNHHNHNNHNKSYIINPRVREAEKHNPEGSLCFEEGSCLPLATAEEESNRFVPTGQLPASHQVIINAWNRQHIKYFYGLYPTGVREIFALLELYDLGTIVQAIESIGKSAFLQGKCKYKDFRITFGWMLKPDNFAKILSGKYLDHSVPEEDDAIPSGSYSPEVLATAKLLGVQLQ